MSSKGSLFGKFGFVKPEKESEDKGLCPPDTMFRICSYLQRLYIVLKILGYPIYYFFTCALLKRDHKQDAAANDGSDSHDTCCCMGSCTCASCATAAIQQQPINNAINSRNSTAAKVVQNKAESNAVLRIESRTFLNPFVLYTYDSIRDSVGKEGRDEEISDTYYPEKLDYYRLQSLFYPPNCSIF